MINWCFFRINFFLLVFFSNLTAFEISEKGYWIGDVEECHAIDGYLGLAIADFFVNEGASSVVDFGCGIGAYVNFFLDKGIAAEGYDGNPLTPE